MQQLITCAQCGKPHEIGHIEPSLRRPDDIIAIPQELRSRVAIENKDDCVLYARPHSPWVRPFLARRQGFGRYFLRVLMPFAVTGRDQPINWGIWVEVSRASYRLTCNLWNSPEQHKQPPFEGRVANSINGYPPTIGLPGSVQLEDPSRVPTFTLHDGDHPFISEQRHGVTEATVLAWLNPILHPR